MQPLGSSSFRVAKAAALVIWAHAAAKDVTATVHTGLYRSHPGCGICMTPAREERKWSAWVAGTGPGRAWCSGRWATETPITVVVDDDTFIQFDINHRDEASDKEW